MAFPLDSHSSKALRELLSLARRHCNARLRGRSIPEDASDIGEWRHVAAGSTEQRQLDLQEKDQLNEAQLAAWTMQASLLSGDRAFYGGSYGSDTPCKMGFCAALPAHP